ncbi:C-type lectin domain-containing protein [Trichostrongylus colubriformis]|uniref:C-type lectin domain-containing protein n=1 Tax=Trichostrongylus colubriformis TaxID=6319 RepID=A0AAN8FL64_TRICO
MYEVYNKAMSWKQAKEFCKSKGSMLAMIKSDLQNSDIHEIATEVLGPNKRHLLWIGLQRTGSSWTWVDGSPATYTKWISDQPDNWRGDEDCVHMYVATNVEPPHRDRHWNDIACNRTDVYVVCQRYPG